MPQPRAVVEAQRLVGREQVVGEPVGDEQRRRVDAVVEVVRGVIRGDLVGHRHGLRIGGVGLPRVRQREPLSEVGVAGRREARGRVEAAQGSERVEAAHEGLLHDAHRIPVILRAGDRVVERAPAGQQGVDEVGPRDERGGGGDLHGLSPGALPGDERSVEVHLAVAQDGERHRLAASVRAAGGADPLRVDDPLVGQLAGQVLGVAHLVAGVREVDPPLRAPRRVGEARRRRPAGLAEPAGGVVDDRVSLLRPRLHVREARLLPAPAVKLDDERKVRVAGGR